MDATDLYPRMWLIMNSLDILPSSPNLPTPCLNVDFPIRMYLRREYFWMRFWILLTLHHNLNRGGSSRTVGNRLQTVDQLSTLRG